MLRETGCDAVMVGRGATRDPWIFRQTADLLAGRAPHRPTLEELTLEEVERLLMQKALRRHDGNVSRAAEALGISRSAFYRRMQKYGL